MKKVIYIVSFLLIYFAAHKGFGQIFTDSNLPIVVINTDLDSLSGLPIIIPDEPKILADMKIIYHSDGSRNYMNDINNNQFLNYNGRIGIELRGSTSQVLPKKPYSITTLIPGSTSTLTTQNVSLLGMPSESDWILNSLAFDASLIRDNLSYYLARQMGNYAPRTMYCEVVINEEYVGLYMLSERLKVDANRINIQEITPSDSVFPNVSGGYVTKADKITGEDSIAWYNVAYNGANVDYVHHFPNTSEVTPHQNNYIQSVFNNLSIAASANNSSLLDGYTTIIDVPSFIDFMILNELASNVDGYQISTFFHKDKNGKLRAGPIWDFNLTFGNDNFSWGFDRSLTDVWQFSNGDNEGSKFWMDLFSSDDFRCYFSKRWNELTQNNQPLNQSLIDSYIDSNVLFLKEAINREHQKWWTIPDNASEISNLKAWVAERTAWISNNVGDFTNCANVVVPALVISQIHYNPQPVTSPIPYSANDQEFLQITNNSNVSVDLSGIYISQLGVSYQFPFNSSIPAGGSIYLASDTTIFHSRYGLTAFGQFTRNLSNKTQNIVLSDAFGNEIDKVEYFDTAPWPIDADGNGSYLQLIDNNLDNNLASSWVASSNSLTVTAYDDQKAQLVSFPNYANEIITIKSSEIVDGIEIFDTRGKLVFFQKMNEFTTTINVAKFPAGLYLIRLLLDGNINTLKFYKE